MFLMPLLVSFVVPCLYLPRLLEKYIVAESELQTSFGVSCCLLTIS